ncbi:SRPBCC domain-containing protein [Chitinophaga sp. XS-30]|uniref:SRPBCC family protein n=1 Tax=Chitinophaga sp. XS-30 TaxID=2604421 RepID=UPI0011DE4A46|nr:SRPBCC domain-containing protein [Chitinophaga sp. XS-30]QEH41819.1 SRPBCC domain-containing protein [Chitinophaga sp. XS-30]
MNNNLQFDFVADKTNNTITMKREFMADRQLVWDCYTKSELLDQWFAPAPLTTKTSSMDFREGGHWLYAMVEPDGKEYWGRMDYLEIRPIDGYRGLDGFCDNNGVLNPELPQAKWDTTFSDFDENTIVHMIVTYDSLADLETVINMGMQEGMILTLQKLDDLLSRLRRK